MNHQVFGRKLSRSKNERKRLFSSLVRELILHSSIRTSKAKAKAVQPLVDTLITKAKRGADADRRRIYRTLTDKQVVDMLMADAKDRFAARNSGFTRIIALDEKRSDGVREVMISFVDAAIKREPKVRKEGKAKKPAQIKEEKKTETKKESKPEGKRKAQKKSTS